jgi:hypothetical protein
MLTFKEFMTINKISFSKIFSEEIAVHLNLTFFKDSQK